MALGFLSLPAEIRNQIYSYLFPTKENPQAFKMCPPEFGNAEDTSEEDPISRELDIRSSRRQQGTPRMDIPFGLYSSCITIYQEVPSIDSLIASGAIIPTIDPFQIHLCPELKDFSLIDLVQRRRHQSFCARLPKHHGYELSRTRNNMVWRRWCRCPHLARRPKMTIPGGSLTCGSCRARSIFRHRSRHSKSKPPIP